MFDTRNPIVLRSVEDLADAKELRSVISAALTRAPIDEDELQCAVWSFVGTEHRAGVAPAAVISRLTGLIDGAAIDTATDRLALTHRVILWCVEEYFGSLGGSGLLADISPDSAVADAPANDADGRSHLRLLGRTPTPVFTPPKTATAVRLQPFAEYRNTRLWSIIGESIKELRATREVSINTTPDYVIGYLCQELVAKKLVASTGSDR